MSKSKSRVASILKMKTINGREVPSEPDIRNKIAGIEKKLAAVKGISNVSARVDMQNYIATLDCHFDNISSLNDAVKKIGESEKAPPGSVEKNYDYNNSIFSRLSAFSLKKDYQQLSNADKEIFVGANFTGIYRFDKKVLHSENQESKISSDNKAVMLRMNILDIITDKKSIQNKITLTK